MHPRHPRAAAAAERRATRVLARLELASRDLRGALAAALLATGGLAVAAEPADIEIGDGLCPAPLASADFGDGTLEGWSAREFARGARYEIVEDGAGARVLLGTSEGGAALLWREHRVELAQTPLLEWRWRVDTPLEGERADERTRAGDDFAARVYVLADEGLLPWKARSLTYVWTSKVPAGTVWTSPYAKNARLIALADADALDPDGGAWRCERRDVAADFARAFGEPARALAAQAVMVDADNGGGTAAARFAGLRFVMGGDS